MTNLWKCCDFLAAAKVDLSCVLCVHVCSNRVLYAQKKEKLWVM